MVKDLIRVFLGLQTTSFLPARIGGKFFSEYHDLGCESVRYYGLYENHRH
jgi:hypothetical protein